MEEAIDLGPFAAIARPLLCRPGQHIPDPQRTARAKTANERRKVRRWPVVPNPWGLSGTEWEVLRQVIDTGLSFTDVAKRLSLSQKTVGTHMMRIREKMNANSTMHAVLLADRWVRGDKPQDVEVVLRYIGGRATVELRGAEPPAGAQGVAG